MTFPKALLVICFLIGILIWSLVFGSGEIHIPLVASTIFAGIIALLSGYTLEEIEHSMLKTITVALQPLVIMLIVGILVGTWMTAGIVPTMIYYGLKIVNPKFFLVTTAIICGIVALAIGSSWTTMSTIGIALFGISMGLGIPPAMTVGAIVSGSYFGDKMSPLSETTNMAPAVAGSTLFDHIRHMLYTTGVSLVLSLIFFTVVGFRYAGSSAMDTQSILTISNTIHDNFTISPLMFAVPIIVLVLAMKKIPAIPTLVAGVLCGCLVAVTVQGRSLNELMSAAQYGFVLTSGNEAVDNLLSRGGLESMYFNISLIMIAMCLGGVLEGTGILQVISEKIILLVHSRGSLVTATVLSCIAVNIATGEQALSLVIPGRIFSPMFEQYRLKPQNLSRCLEDAGTLTSPLFAWNSCGAFVMSLFGVSAWAYFPFAFLNYINPLISVIYGWTGFSMLEYTDEEWEAHQKEQAALQ